MPRPNYSFPQAGITRSSYAPSLDYTRPREVVDGYEVKLDPFTGEERFAEGGGVSANAPQQSLEQYYQSLLAPPQQQPYDPSFFNYMQSLNKYVTSPVAPPPPPPPPPPPSGYVKPSPGTVAGTYPDNIDYSAIQNALSGMFSGYGNFDGFDFSSLQNNLNDGSGGLTWDSAQGRFVNPSQMTATNTQSPYQFNPYNGYGDTMYAGGTQGFYDNPMNNRPAQPYQYNPVSGIKPIDPSNLPPETEADLAARQKYLSAFDMSGDPLSFSGRFDGSSDTGGYGTQFQGFQPLSTDFGSTYQPSAINTPTFDYSSYMPQQTDFGSMGYGLGSLPSISSTYQPQVVETPTFDTSTFQMPAPQAPMMTSADTGVSNVSTAPQFGFGNSDVLYGQSNFGLGGGEPNIFGFAGGGSVQHAAAGKLITGDGDGMSDDIRANINGDQEARLADGEFVIPADVVSHLGNGSTDAGADQLHAMMDRIRKARTGRTQQAPEIDADEYLLA